MKLWVLNGMAVLPFSLIVWTYLTFSISYIIAVARGDVDPGLPYISDTGARRPESSVFGQMLNISAVLGMLYLLFFLNNVIFTKVDQEHFECGMGGGLD